MPAAMEENGAHVATGSRTLAFLTFAALCLLAGCHRAASSPGGEEDADLRRGQEITQKMLAAYRHSKSYADHATYTQHAVRVGDGVERDQPFFDMAVAFERPNRLRLSFEESVEGSAGRKGFDIASNGVAMRVTSGLFPGQVQESIAPKKLTPANLLPDVLLRDIFVSRTLGDVFPQLAMLLNEDDKTAVFPEDEHPRHVDTQQLRGRNCYRVYTTSPRGKRTFWIDAENYMLRRMEVPIEADMKALDPDHQYSQLAIWIDFEDSAFNTPIDGQAFEKTIAATDHRVRRFVAPPPAAPPASLGKPLPEFEFQTLDGKPVTAKDFAGKTVLLDFWQLECPPCKAQTPALERLYQELKKETNFAWYAVDAEEGRIPAETLKGTLERWGGTMPILGDSRADAWNKIKIDRTPTLLLVDAQGRLQLMRSEEEPDAKALGSVIRRVIAGVDLAAEARNEHAQLVKDYERELASVTISDAVLQVEVPQPQPAERKLPEKLTAAELWHADADDIAHPGNILAVTQPNEDKKDELQRTFLVLDGGEAVVEFDAEGARLERHEIYSTGESANAFIREALGDPKHKTIAVSGVGWQKVRVFDGNWKQILEFPKDRHPGIADVQLTSEGDPTKSQLIVGYWGGVGVQGVDLDGRRKWSQRAIDQVVQISSIAAPRKISDAKVPGELWCTSNRGTISVLDDRGKPQHELHVGSVPVMYFNWGMERDPTTNGDFIESFCGLALESVGNYQAVGFNRDGELTWRYPLPAGEYAHHVERIQSVELPGKKFAWMIAAADGTIFWLDHEGKLIDKFQYGQPLTGLALTNTADAAILLVSTPTNLTAWKLSEKK